MNHFNCIERGLRPRRAWPAPPLPGLARGRVGFPFTCVSVLRGRGVVKMLPGLWVCQNVLNFVPGVPSGGEGDPVCYPAIETKGAGPRLTI